jgi:hypothetical protein
MPFKDPEKRREYGRLQARKRYATNPEKQRAAQHRWRARHPGESAAAMRAHRAADPERAKAQAAAQEQRRKEDPVQHEKQLTRARADRTRLRAEQPRKVLSSKLKSLYHITLEQYEQLHEAQGGVCAICKRPETATDKRTGKKRRLAVDHTNEHGVFKVRGLLCQRHNMAIGLFGHSIALLLAATDYLRGPPAYRVLA